jgi:hypothetical protein
VLPAALANDRVHRELLAVSRTWCGWCAQHPGRGARGSGCAERTARLGYGPEAGKVKRIRQFQAKLPQDRLAGTPPDADAEPSLQREQDRRRAQD